MGYLKDLVVLFHEICHALATILTGGVVEKVAIHNNESGETIAIPSKMKGAFVFIVSSGYIGSSFLGGLVLHRGFSGKYEKQTLTTLGILLLITTFKFSSSGNLAYTTGIVWGALFLIVGILNQSASAMTLVFIGTLVSLYSVYDLLDFTGNIHHTDAGILAYWFLNISSLKGRPPGSVMVLSHAIAALWSFVSLTILYFTLKKTFKVESAEEQPELPIEQFPGEVTPEVAEWFISRGLDLNGKPLPQELISEFKREG